MYELTNRFSLALLILLVAIILSKHGVKIYMALRGKTKQSDGHKQLDQLIKQNELKFRGMDKPQQIVNQQELKLDQLKDSLEHSYEKSADPEEKKTADFFILLLKEFQWGEGEKLNLFSKKLNATSPLPLNNYQCKSFAQFLLANGLLYPFQNSDRIIKYPLIESYLTYMAFLFKLLQISKDKNYTNYAKIFNSSKNNFENSVLHFFTVLQGSEFNQSLKILFHQKQSVQKQATSFTLQSFAPICLNLATKNSNLFWETWHKCLNLWSSMSPLDLKTADQVFTFLGVKPGSPEKVIKMKINSEIKKRHPDTYSRYNLPTEYEKIVTENFQQLQEAIKKIKS